MCVDVPGGSLRRLVCADSWGFIWQAHIYLCDLMLGSCQFHAPSIARLQKQVFTSKCSLETASMPFRNAECWFFFSFNSCVRTPTSQTCSVSWLWKSSSHSLKPLLPCWGNTPTSSLRAVRETETFNTSCVSAKCLSRS